MRSWEGWRGRGVEGERIEKRYVITLANKMIEETKRQER
jgi:hypothetical protein